MKTKKPTFAVKLVLFIGVAAFAAAVPLAHAQTTDALIDKLVDKGILTTAEAKELRAETDSDFKTAFAARTGMPDWVNGYKISGDVRGRFEQFASDNTGLIDRTRLRYRLRFGVKANLLDNLEAGFRLGSGDPVGGAGNPLSQSSTFKGNWSDKNVYIDTAYGKWTAVSAGKLQLAAMVGKMDNPFSFTPMVFDVDLTPEGGALTGSYMFNDKHSLNFAAAAFVLDEQAGTTHDPFLFGGQITWNAKWTEKWATSAGLGAFSIVSPESLTTANVPLINQGNTREAVPYTPPFGSATTLYMLAYNYTPLIANASVTYTADTFPFYNGAFPIKFSGEVMHNPGAPKNNNGFWVGVTLGKAGTKQTWDITYRYEYLGADAWYDQLVDDDNAAFYPGDMLGANSAFGLYGGTNIKGHLVQFNYSFTDSMTFSVTCYLNSLIGLDGLSSDIAVPNTKTSDTIHIMADITWKF